MRLVGWEQLLVVAVFVVGRLSQLRQLVAVVVLPNVVVVLVVAFPLVVPLTAVAALAAVAAPQQQPPLVAVDVVAIVRS